MAPVSACHAGGGEAVRKPIPRHAAQASASAVQDDESPCGLLPGHSVAMLLGLCGHGGGNLRAEERVWALSGSLQETTHCSV